MFNDKKFGCLFPTRTGGATGTANERKMLDAISGSEGFRTRMQTAADGSVTMLRTRNGRPEFTTVKKQLAAVIELLYMDNGFVTPGYWSYDATVDQAQATFTNSNGFTVSGYVEVIDSAIEVEPKPFNSLFKSFSTRAVIGQPPSLTDADWLKVKNIAIRLCPPAMFTGLARRYVSAIYGKKIKYAREAEMSFTDVGAYGILTYDGVTLNPGQVTTGIVFSLMLKKYWMVNVAGNSMTYQAMIPDANGLKILELINGTTSERDKALHSYVLSTARVKRNEYGGVSWLDGGTFETIGAPLNFGWRFNSDGTKFTAVTLDQYGPYISDSRLYEGVIAISASGVLSASVSVTESVLGWRSNRVKLFSPIAPANFKWQFTGTVDEAVPNAPLLSFYDSADTLKVCRYSRHVGDTEANYAGGITGKWGLGFPLQIVPAEPVCSGPCGAFAPGTNITTYGVGVSTYDRKLNLPGNNGSISLGVCSITEQMTASEYSWSGGLSTMNSDWALVSNNQTYAPGQLLPGGALEVNGSPNCGNTAAFGGPEGGYYAEYRRGYSGSSTSTNTDTGRSVNGVCCFVAPQDCATAWYEMLFVGSAVGRTLNIAKTVPNQFTEYRIVTNYETFITWTSTNHTGGESTVEDIPPTNTGVTSIKCCTSVGYTDITTLAGDSVPKAYKFFGAQSSNPIVNAMVIVREDQHGSLAVSNPETETLQYYGWPEVGTHSVGWQ